MKSKNRKPLPFVHLHAHGEYSIKDAVGSVEEYIDLAIKYKMPYFTMTDHGSIGCWIRQYFHIIDRQQEGHNVQGIFGFEPYISKNRDESLARIKEINEVELKKNKGNKEKLEELRQERKKLSKYYHLILLAKNETGKKNLIYIHNEAQKNGFYYVPRASYDVLEEHCEGIIITSACMGSDVSQALINDDWKQAKKLVKYYKKLVGDDYYIEMQLHDTTGQDKLNEKLMKLAEETDTKLIITNDCHYPLKRDSIVQDTLLLMQNNNTWADVEKGKNRNENDVDENTKKVWLFESKQLWYKTEQEIYEEWEKNHKSYMPYEVYEEAILNTVEIAEKCTPDISFGEEKGNYIPQCYGSEEEARKLLMGYCREGFKERKLHLKKDRKTYIARLEHEVFNIITATECANYLLIVREYVVEAKEKYGVESVGPGRGCFTPYNRIVTDNGLQYIKEVQVGDKVKTNQDTFHEVIDKYKYDVDEEITEINCENESKIECTSDHKILAIKQEDIDKFDGTDKSEVIRWYSAGELRDGDYIIKI